jgi:hypothetical protein
MCGDVPAGRISGRPDIDRKFKFGAAAGKNERELESRNHLLV